MSSMAPETRQPLSQVGNVFVDNPPTNAASSVPLGHSPIKPFRRPASPNRSVIAKASPLVSRASPDASFGLFAADKDDCKHIIVCPKSLGLIIGRARASPNEEEADLTSEPKDITAGGPTPLRRVTLPSSAKHVSRDHCVVYHTPFAGNTWAVKILGQNGLIVDGTRYRAGSILRLIPHETKIDFFGLCCLFVGPSAQKEAVTDCAPAFVSHKEGAQGRSPSKAAARPLTIAASKLQQLHSAAAGVAVAQQKTKFLGNTHKRPKGAPLSPPTSSPAPFDASSSPVRGRTAGRIVSSSPAPAVSDDVDDDDDDDEEESLSRAVSPTLQRVSVKSKSKAIMTPRDDSGVMLRDESEDEASQALAVLKKEPKADRKVRDRKRTTSGLIDDDAKGLSRSRTSSPHPQRSEAKRVKFTAGSQAGGNQSTGTVKSVAVLASTMQAVQTHYRTLVGRLAGSYDLQGLLAGAIVFHRTATISATEAVRSVLASNPTLMRGEVGPEKDGEKSAGAQRGNVLPGWTHQDIVESAMVKEGEVEKERVEVWQRKAWRECLEQCLMEGECFGIIQRAGKDASGNPLECWYYYDKEQDSDAQRAANLGPFVKPMRAALKTHKPIFWRKSAYGTSSDDVVSTKAAETSTTAAPLATESQWGSSGSTLKAAVLSNAGEQGTTTLDSSSRKPERTADVDRQRERLSSMAWEETQMEETEQTWDREGDLDFEIGTGSSRKSSVKKRK